MADKGLDVLFADTLKDMYYAENEVLKELPKLQAAAESEELKQAFQRHIAETEQQVRRLEQVFDMIGKKPEGKKCEGITGIMKEGEKVLAEFKATVAADASLIGSAQAVEHYEITRYGTLRRWARMLDMDEAYELLTQSLEEESRTDELLTQIADAGVNREAAEGATETKSPRTSQR